MSSYLPLLEWFRPKSSTGTGVGEQAGPMCEAELDPVEFTADLAERAGNAAAQGTTEGLVAPPAVDQGPLRDWLTWGKPRGDGALQAGARQEAAVYELLLAMKTVTRSGQAAADRLLGQETEATQIDDLQRRVGEGVRAFSEIPLPGGGFIPAPYMLNLNEDDYALRRATRVPLDDLEPAARRGVRSGKGSVEQLTPALQGFEEDEAWKNMSSTADDPSARYAKKLARVLPSGADPLVDRTARVAATAQTAGVGVDCAGFVLQALGRAGLMPDSAIDNRGNLGVRGVLNQGERFGNGREAQDGSPSPLDAEGKLRLRPGDMMQIQNALGPEGHISVVMQAEDLGEEIVVKYAHSTDNQSVKTGDAEIGTRVEGVREDLVAYDKATGAWRTIRGAYGSEELDETRIRGFSRPSEQR